MAIAVSRSHPSPMDRFRARSRNQYIGVSHTKIHSVFFGILGVACIVGGAGSYFQLGLSGQDAIIMMLYGPLSFAISAWIGFDEIKLSQIRKCLEVNDLKNACEILQRIRGDSSITDGSEIISQKIIEQGEIDASFRVIENTPHLSELKKRNVVFFVYEMALEQGKIGVALQVLRNTSRLGLRNSRPECNRIIDKALEMNKADAIYRYVLEHHDPFLMITDDGKWEAARSYFAKKAISEGNLEGALRMCPKSGEHANSTLSYIVRKVCIYPWEIQGKKATALDRAFEQVPTITDEEERNKVLFFIAFRAMLDQNSPHAVRARNMITSGWIKSHPRLKEILLKKIEQNNFASAFILAKDLRLNI